MRCGSIHGNSREFDGLHISGRASLAVLNSHWRLPRLRSSGSGGVGAPLGGSSPTEMRITMAAGYYDISDHNVATTSADQRGSGISGPGAMAFRFFAASRGVVSLSLVFAWQSESKEQSESSTPGPPKYSILPLRSGLAPYRRSNRTIARLSRPRCESGLLSHAASIACQSGDIRSTCWPPSGWKASPQRFFSYPQSSGSKPNT